MIEVIKDASDFEKLRDDWNELLQSGDSDRIFLTWEWLHTWWKHLSGDRKLHILTVRSGGKLSAIAPLALSPSQLTLSPFPSLEFLGTGNVGSDYLDFIIRRGKEQEALKAVAGYLRGEKLMVRLAQVQKGISFSKGFVDQLTQLGWSCLETNTDVCPFINLSNQSWESYLAGLGSSHRSNFRRRFKNLEKTFDMQFERIESEEKRHGAIKILIDLHNLRWKGRGASSAFHTPGLVSFHEEFSRLALERGWLRLYVLWLNGRPAAALYGFKYGPVFSFYQSGLDPEFEKQSVGLVTMGLAIQRAVEEGAQEYDLLHGDEPYKFLWSREVRELTRLELYPPQLRGFIYRQTMGWLRTIRKAAKHVITPKFN